MDEPINLFPSSKPHDDSNDVSNAVEHEIGKITSEDNPLNDLDLQVDIPEDSIDTLEHIQESF